MLRDGTDTWTFLTVNNNVYYTDTLHQQQPSSPEYQYQKD